MTTTNPILRDAQQFARTVDAELFPSGATSKSSAGAGREVVHHHRREVVHHHHHRGYGFLSDPFWFYGASPRAGCSNKESSCSSKESSYSSKESSFSSGKVSSTSKDNSSLIIAVVAVVAFITSYFVGKDVGRVVQSGRNIRKLEGVEIKSDKVQKVVQIHKKMLGDIYSTGRTGVILKSSLVSAAIVTGAGVALAAPVAATAGFVGAGLSTGLLVVRQGYNDADTTQKEDVAQLKDALTQAIKA